jgi:hypothetical protein
LTSLAELFCSSLAIQPAVCIQQIYVGTYTLCTYIWTYTLHTYVNTHYIHTYIWTYTLHMYTWTYTLHTYVFVYTLHIHCIQTTYVCLYMYMISCCLVKLSLNMVKTVCRWCWFNSFLQIRFLRWNVKMQNGHHF